MRLKTTNSKLRGLNRREKIVHRCYEKNHCMVQAVFNAGLVHGLFLEMEEKEIIAKRRLIDNSTEEELFTWGKNVKICKCCAWIQVIENFVWQASFFDFHFPWFSTLSVTLKGSYFHDRQDEQKMPSAGGDG